MTRGRKVELCLALAVTVVPAGWMAGYVIDWQVSKRRSAGQLSSPFLLWHHGGERYLVLVWSEAPSEQRTYEIEVVTQRGEAIFSGRYTIYENAPTQDGGVVAALQADEDAEREIVIYGEVWHPDVSTALQADGPPAPERRRCAEPGPKTRAGRRAYRVRRSLYLDFRRGRVVEVPFCRAAAPAQRLMAQWAAAHLGPPLRVVLYGVLCLVWCGGVWGLFAAMRFGSYRPAPPAARAPP